jgi:glucose-6-phosphate 1-epimerase
MPLTPTRPKQRNKLQASMTSIQDLNQQFAVGDFLTFAKHPSGLMMGIVKTPLCEASFFLQGAHVSHFHPTISQHPVLFMSDSALYEPGRPIRGGIPICFPWFSSHPNQPSLPAHGWARTSEWQVTSTRMANQNIEVTLTLAHDDWELNYHLTFGADLHVSLIINNLAANTRTFEIALHTYFDIGAIQQTEIKGDLAQLQFLDQLTAQIHSPHPAPIKFEAETDRIYQGSAPNIQIHDGGYHRTIRIQAVNSNSTIVWNPWIAKSIRMADFGDDEYLRMCCVETANVRQQEVSLAPTQSHAMQLKISVQDHA